MSHSHSCLCGRPMFDYTKYCASCIEAELKAAEREIKRLKTLLAKK